MKIHVLNTGYFKLDGGAMFGVVPKVIWQKSNPPDENNMCSWAMRSLLIEDGNRLMLIDAGIGDKQNEKFFSHFYRYGNDSLHGNLAKLGFHASDVTDVFLISPTNLQILVRESNVKEYIQFYKSVYE